jgi:hypothetical protein
MTLVPKTAPPVCVAHRRHEVVTPYYNELHHVIPQAWQEFWWPTWNDGEPRILPNPLPGDPFATAVRTPLKRLFDPRTVALCPTGHRNVHWLLVKFMRYWDAIGVGPKEQSEEVILELAADQVAAIRHDGLKVNRGEALWARESMLRWHQVGGNLADLCKAHKWGEA